MDYESIFYQNEEQYTKINNERMKNFVYLFLKVSRINVEEINSIYDIKENDYMDFYDSLKKVVFRFYPNLIPIFYELLKQNGYNMIYEIQEDMFYLGSTTNKGLNKEEKNILKLSPFIKDIDYQQSKITLYSEIFGNYSFYSIRDYFRDDYLVKKYIRKIRCSSNDKKGGICHNSSWELMQLLNNASLVTELLPYCYESTYYHSVIRNEDGMIIDVANEVVYDEKIRKDLYQGKIICETKKDDLESNLYDAIVASQNPYIEEEFNEPLLLALHRQCIDKRKKY